VELNGSVIIVTGSATGLGAAVARGASAKGARVVVNYTKSEAEAKTTARACQDLGGDAILCRADVASDEDCRRMADSAVEKWGRIDGLVNNAGQSVFASAADLESLSGQDFLDIYSVNVVGAYQMVRAVTPHLKAGGQGSIVNVSSISAITGGGSSIAYAASKAALNSMTLSLARALAPTVRVNSVCPGPIPTRWWGDGLGEDGARELFRKFAEQVPLQEAPTAESVAETVVWLLEAGGHITGETIMIDSGMHLIGFKP
jgi:3-oxoacyl-[acyl-carrier protein] reductase